MIGELRGPGDHRPTRARHPDAIVVDAALQLAAAPVLEVESVESGGEGGGHGLPNELENHLSGDQHERRRGRPPDHRRVVRRRALSA